MHAILYAAGRAIRLGALAESRNKVLLEFKGQSLLERHVLLLTQAGINLVYVVTGHRREQLCAAFPDLESRYPVQMAELFNPDYTEGSALSMAASLPALANVRDQVLLMDADVLYDGRMLDRLIRSPHRTAMLVDREYSTVDDDPVLVPLREGQPFEFRKKWKGDAELIGESIGFFRVHAADLPVLVDETLDRTQGPGRAESYDEIIRAMVKRGVFMAEDVTGLPWTEIDFPHDIEYAERVVVPALQQ